MEEFAAAFEAEAAQGHDILAMALSSGISGTYNFMCSARKIVLEKYHARCVSDTVFTLKGYIIYCFAPVVIIGTVLLILNIVLPDRFFWQVYIIQIINIAGAASR